MFADFELLGLKVLDKLSFLFGILLDLQKGTLELLLFGFHQFELHL